MEERESIKRFKDWAWSKGFMFFDLAPSINGRTVFADGKVDAMWVLWEEMDAQHERDQARIKKLEYELAETGDALLREDRRSREARRQAQDECVQAILNGNQFFLAGIEPEMRESVIRRALNL